MLIMVCYDVSNLVLPCVASERLELDYHCVSDEIFGEFNNYKNNSGKMGPHLTVRVRELFLDIVCYVALYGQNGGRSSNPTSDLIN